MKKYVVICVALIMLLVFGISGLYTAAGIVTVSRLQQCIFLNILYPGGLVEELDTYIITRVHSGFYWSRTVIYYRTDTHLMPF